MYRIRRGCLIAGLLLSNTLGAQTSEAQYTANFQTNIISGATSNWTGSYIVGSNTCANTLLIQNSGALSNGNGYLGYEVSSSNNSVAVTGSGSAWSNYNYGLSFMVGRSGAGNSLVISNGGQVASPLIQATCTLGYYPSSSNNNVIVTDTGSVWRADSDLYVGNDGQGNSLVISNGGQVFDGNGEVGFHSDNNSVVITGTGSVWNSSNALDIGGQGSSNKLLIKQGGWVISGGPGLASSGFGSFPGSNSTALVTDPGSVWSNRSMFLVGFYGQACSMVISNCGRVVSENYADMGDMPGSSVNSVRVVDGGVWQNTILHIGNAGTGNTLVVAGGSVVATNLVVGFATTDCGNVVELDSGNVIVTNATGTGVLEVRHGKLIMNGGVLQADTLVITNPCAQFIHTGGTLIVGSVVLDPNTFRIVSVAPTGNDMLVTWMMGPGATNTLQATSGDGSGGYSTNGFTDIFVVTNNAAIGTVTNYLDIGAATNKPSRYYRARLVP